MNDASILENMQRRHEQDQVYTYTASVLLAVNPYRQIPGLYSEDLCKEYRGRHIGALPPHPYAIAESAYRLLGRESKNQAMLISGESGAGKTETAKIVMQYLAFVSGTGSDFAAELATHVQRSQPVLESFGNAATLRNSNSSRFGKYNRIFFDDEGSLAHASITTYLLESSRVVGHAGKERTYHVFYEMLAGLSEDQLNAFHLRRDAPYRLLHNNGEPVKASRRRMPATSRGFAKHCKPLAMMHLR
jgi:myosin-5